VAYTYTGAWVMSHQLNPALAMTLRFATLRPATIDTDRLIR
jgi:hypothetical protein